MKIWHLGAECTPKAVNGVNALIYSLAREQAHTGHNVTIVLHRPPSEEAVSFAKDTGVEFLQLPTVWIGHKAFISSVPHSSRPDIVHMHSVFITQQAAIGQALYESSIPYVITPNGGLSPYILNRSRWKKIIYSSFVERRRFQRAAGISAVTPKEKSEILSYANGFAGLISWIPNSFDPTCLEGHAWLPSNPAKITYLGRFDIVHKGLDLVLEIARRLPLIEFHLYGPNDNASRTVINTLTASAPNVFFHPPVFREEKASVLAHSTFYIQMSRWEAFGVSIAEAMYIGLPCVLAENLHIAPIFQENNLGLVVPRNPDTAAELILSALSDPERLKLWSKRAREFAESQFHPSVVALRFTDFYRESLSIHVQRQAQN